MSRWIDAEWLLNFFEPYPDDYQTPLGTLRACADDAPSIDIVRCGECKHRGDDHWFCCNLNLSSDAKSFCSFGDRKESE